MAFKGGFISLIPRGPVPTSLLVHSCQPLHFKVLPLSQNVTVAPGTCALETMFYILCRSLLQHRDQEKVVEHHLWLSLLQARGGESPLWVETDCSPSWKIMWFEAEVRLFSLLKNPMIWSWGRRLRSNIQLPAAAWLLSYERVSAFLKW